MLFYHFIYQQPHFLPFAGICHCGVSRFLIQKGVYAPLPCIVIFFSNKWQNSNLAGAFRLFLCR